MQQNYQETQQQNNQKDQKYQKQEIKLSQEEGFNLQTCFEIQESTIGYQKDKDYYYDSYSHFNIHEDMLKDQVRTFAYQNSIKRNKHLFQNKIVLDVGSGTGILSIFAANAGAKHVYGVDNANISEISKQIIQDNKLQDRITIIKGKIEEVEIPEKVDIIISEWMGYFLLYESMLDSVIYARDKYLKPDGLMFPDRAVLYLSTMEDGRYRNEKLQFWENQYGVNMSCINSWVLREPIVETIDKKQVNGDAVAILDIDLQTVTKAELDFNASYKIKINRNDGVHAFISWFEVYFNHCHIPIRLSTSPFSKETHWKQTIFYLEKPFKANKFDTVVGSVAVKKSTDNPRNIDVKLSIYVNSPLNQLNYIQNYKMN